MNIPKAPWRTYVRRFLFVSPSPLACEISRRTFRRLPGQLTFIDLPRCVLGRCLGRSVELLWAGGTDNELECLRRGRPIPGVYERFLPS